MEERKVVWKCVSGDLELTFKFVVTDKLITDIFFLNPSRIWFRIGFSILSVLNRHFWMSPVKKWRMCQTREVCMHQLLSYFQHKLFRKHVKPQSRKGCKQMIKCFPILKSNLRVVMNIWLTDVQIHLGCQALSFCKCCFNSVLLHYCLLGCFFFFVGEEKRKLFKVLFRSWLSGRLKSCRCSQETTGLKTVLILIYI